MWKYEQAYANTFKETQRDESVQEVSRMIFIEFISKKHLVIAPTQKRIHQASPQVEDKEVGQMLSDGVVRPLTSV